MKINTKNSYLPVVLIADGILYRDNLRHAGLSETSLKERLLKLGVPRYDQIFMAFTGEKRTLMVYSKNDRGRLLSAKGGDR